MEIIVKNEQFEIVWDQIHSLTFYKTRIPEELFSYTQSQFKSIHRQAEWLHTHYLIFQLTGVFQSYGFDKWKKPFCNITKHYISITHTEHYVALMLMKKGRGGVDMEEADRNFIKTAPKFLHNDEQKWCQKNDCLRQIWCFKEAAYKLIPDASADFKTHYICKFDSNNAANVEYLPLSINIRMNYVKNENYFLTWCFEKE